MDVLKHLEEILKPQHQLVAAGVPSERATEIVTNLDLSFTARKGSVTNRYRESLKAIAQGIDININFLLNNISLEQIEEVVNDHKHILWYCPIDINLHNMVLSSIDKVEGAWVLRFLYANSSNHAGDYQLHDLEIQDVLGLLSTIENILVP